MFKWLTRIKRYLYFTDMKKSTIKQHKLIGGRLHPFTGPTTENRQVVFHSILWCTIKIFIWGGGGGGGWWIQKRLKIRCG